MLVGSAVMLFLVRRLLVVVVVLRGWWLDGVLLNLGCGHLVFDFIILFVVIA